MRGVESSLFGFDAVQKCTWKHVETHWRRDKLTLFIEVEDMKLKIIVGPLGHSSELVAWQSMLVGCVSCTVLSFDLDGFRFIISKGSKIQRMRHAKVHHIGPVGKLPRRTALFCWRCTVEMTWVWWWWWWWCWCWCWCCWWWWYPTSSMQMVFWGLQQMDQSMGGQEGSWSMYGNTLPKCSLNGSYADPTHVA